MGIGQLDSQNAAAVSWSEVLDAVSDPVAVIDDAGRIAAANLAYRDAFGEEAFAVVDDLGRELAPAERPQVRAARDTSAAGDFIVAMPTGEKRAFYISATRTAGNRHVTVQLHDINEEHRLQDRFLHHATQKLHKPLERVRRALESLPPHDGCTEAFTALQEAERFVDKLRSLAALPAGKYALQLKQTDFASVVSRAVSSVRRSAPGRTFDFRLDAGPLYVECDAQRVEEVIYELLLNANEHATPGEPVEVHVTHAAGYAVLEVRDKGDLIPAGEIARIFSRFQQVLCPDDNAPEGLGVSLYVSSEVIRAHGGTVTA